MKFALGIAGFMTLGLAAPALAQETELPRFEALEQQQLSLEQDQVDRLARQQQIERDLNLSPNSGVTASDRALRELENRRQLDLLRLEGLEQRAQVARENQIDQASLPNRRIASHSSLVVTDPERHILPPAPAGYYYARVDGRFVLVDGTSELVVKVLEPQPTDPTTDLPARQLPPLQPPPGARGWPVEPATLPSLGTSVTGIRADKVALPPAPSGPSPPKQPPLPTRLIRPDSALVVRDLAGQKLGAPPAGHYYAQLDDRIYLVDARTYLVIALIRP